MCEETGHAQKIDDDMILMCTVDGGDKNIIEYLGNGRFMGDGGLKEHDVDESDLRMVYICDGCNGCHDIVKHIL